MAKRKPYLHTTVGDAFKEKVVAIAKKSKRSESDVVRGLLLRGIKLWNRDGVVHEDDEESAYAGDGPLGPRRRTGT